MGMKAAENLVITVVEKDDAHGEAHNKKREGLQAIQVAQIHSSGGKRQDRLQQSDTGRKRPAVRVVVSLNSACSQTRRHPDGAAFPAEKGSPSPRNPSPGRSLSGLKNAAFRVDAEKSR